ncbi:MAG: Gfo/Idh/MocA family oxidoreductase, partial [Planctomycetia bacterium]|nr:Gfo/Idh/MocA family oxidoreductase [Planctomycetia bacterium]
MGTSLDRREFLQKTTAGMLSAAVLSTAGQAVFAQEPAKKPVRIGVVGTGPRGRWHIQNMLTNQQPLEITAICDIKPAALQAGVDVVKKLSGKEPATYSKDEYDYRNLCQRDDVDAVLAAVPSKWLGRMSIDAMKAGKHAAHEVPGCYTIEECWEMVETKEKTGKHCMLLENCCYGEDNMQIMHMIRQDVFGEPYFGEGSYVHDCRHYLFDSSGKITWRGELVRDAYGSSYNPHGLGSPSKWLGINDGDRFESCVCMMSRPKEAHAYCVAKFGADSEPAK